MRFASVAEVRNELSKYLAWAQKSNERVVITRHGKPYDLIQALTAADLEELEWKQLAKRRLSRAWEGDDEALYDDL